MFVHIFLVISYLLFFAETHVIENPPQYEEKYFDSLISPFSFHDSRTFRQRYLVTTEYAKEDPHLFIYTGNEGDITHFFNVSGIVFNFAKELNAIVVFIEYRYYGKSSVVETFENLSTQLAVNDFVTITRYLQKEYKIKGKTILFGGSYGGMLASWMRIKFPNLVDGAVASSAPNMHFQNLCDPTLFGKVITDAFGRNKDCDVKIRKSFKLLEKQIELKQFSDLERMYKTCQKIENENDARRIISLVEGSVEMMACVNYPYEDGHLPANPVQVTCENIGENPFDSALFLVLTVYYNSTGKTPCFDIKWDKPILKDKRWRYERCTDVILPIEYNGITDFFLPKKWSLDSFKMECKKEFPDIVPNAFLLPWEYHESIIKYASNIIFSNGKLDPWSACGVYKENVFSDSVHTIEIENSAHHLDFRFPNKNDPQSVLDAREKELEIVKEWLK